MSSDSLQVLADEKARPARRLLDLSWVILMGALLVYGLRLYRSGWVCAYMGTDFRGYYASAQIAWQHGFADVYDQNVQNEFQAVLYHRCPDPDYPQPMPRVSMPYPPVFVLAFLPLTLLDFTASYIFWVVLNLSALVMYLVRFSKSLGGRIDSLRLVQWAVCIPFISNLFLGQMNVWLVICLGEFILLFIRGKHVQSGVWLGGMLLKPHTLILLLPGLLFRRNWGAAFGFGLSLFSVLSISFLLAGIQGMHANALMIYQFAGPLIKTATSMMNYRALALYLGNHLPGWLAWTAAVAGAALVVFFVLKHWWGLNHGCGTRMGYILLATCAGTLVISWHSHFYLLMCLIPILIFLDVKGLLPPSVFSTWLFGPFILYGLIAMLRPDLTRDLFGLGMLALSQFLICWSAWRLAVRRM